MSTLAVDEITDTDGTGSPLFPNGFVLQASVVGTILTDATNTGSVVLDFAANQNFVLTLTGNVTLANPTGASIGQTGFIVFIQDGSGNRTVSLGTDFETASGNGVSLSSNPNSTDVVPYIVIAANRILLGMPQLSFA